MISNLSNQNSLVKVFLNEMRDVHIQKDQLRFRLNIERLTQILIYEASKNFNFINLDVETPLGVKSSSTISDQIIIASILRAGLPMHNAVLNSIDSAENCFISAYRHHKKSGEFEIKLEYIASPDLTDKTLVLCDPMVASGASIIATLKQLKSYGQPKKVILLGIIASRAGIEAIQNFDENIDIYIGDVDDELTAKSYIVPGLGDAGDLAFGVKLDK